MAYELRQIQEGEQVEKFGITKDGILYHSVTHDVHFVLPYTAEEKEAIDQDQKNSRPDWAIPENEKPRNHLRGLFSDKSF